MVFVGVKMKPAARAALERARGTRPISQFVRDALRSECLRCGVELPLESSQPNDRAGKGGRATHQRGRGLGPDDPYATDTHELTVFADKPANSVPARKPGGSPARRNIVRGHSGGTPPVPPG